MGNYIKINAHSFGEALITAGYNAYFDPVPDGKINRFGPSKNYWYIFYGEFGLFGDWSGKLPLAAWGKGEPKLDNALQARLAQIKQDYEAEQKTRSRQAARVFDRSFIEGFSPYAEKKKISPGNARFLDEALVVPLVNMQNEIVSIQYIFKDGSKRFFKGVSCKGLFYLTAPVENHPWVIFCEGYATGSSIFEATGIPTVCCLFADNLEPVVKQWRQKLPHAKFLIAGDDDIAREDNPGRTKALEVAELHNCKTIFPIFPEGSQDGSFTDFNDLAKIIGYDELNKQFNDIIVADKDVVYKSARSFLSMKMPEIEYVISPFLPVRGIALVYAGSGYGKTWLTLSMAVMIALGSKMFGEMWSAPVKRRILYVDGEMPLNQLQRRLRQVFDMFQVVDMEDNFSLLSSQLDDNFVRDISKPEGRAFIETNLAASKSNILVLDNLSALSDAEENESKAWNPIKAWLLDLRSRGITTILVHHAGKNNTQRGTSSRIDAVDTVIHLKRPTGYEAQDGAHFIINFEKCRVSNENVYPMEVKLQSGLWKILRDENEGRVTNDPKKDFISKELEEYERHVEDIIRLRYHQNKSIEEISESLGLADVKVKRIIQKYKSLKKEF